MSNIKSITPIGEHQTYDLEVDHEDHQFYLANGVLTSNSHAISYGVDSYMCAYLLTYHQPHWLCSYLESQIHDPDKRSHAMAELQGFGYSLSKIDVNHAVDKWAPLNKQLMPSLQTVKGIGEKAVEELMLQDRPFDSIEDFFWLHGGKWRFTKLNKRSMDALIRLGAFDSFDVVGKGKLFDNYHHMHFVVIENYNELKKSRGKNYFHEIIEVSRGQVKPWSKHDMVQYQIDLLGYFDANLTLNQKIKNKFVELSISSIDNHVGTNLYWFVPMGSKKRYTKKGKEYQVFDVVGETGKTMQLFCWGALHSTRYPLYVPYIAEVTKSGTTFFTSHPKMKVLK